ncbi:hypothetical protein [Sphaerisporangium sp. NPDC051011]|uniref:hypothetical protein n=1 Tax=Sphaerisporangium sp. NPDC051011 TaxID=3155792 RepID=UPI003400F688
MSADKQVKTLHQVRAAHARIAEKVQAERDAVAEARAAGVRWRLIADAVEMAQSNASRKFGKLPFRTEASPKDESVALRKLERAHQAIFDAELDEIKAIAAARDAGVTWQLIADEIGMDQPNAIVKYLPYLEETRSVAVQPSAAERLQLQRSRKLGARKTAADEPEQPAES